MKEFELEPGEQVVRELRMHWFLFLLQIMPFAILILIPFALPKIMLMVPTLNMYAPYIDYHQPLFKTALGIWLLVCWTAAWGAFTRYYLNAWILTNLRIVEIKQRGYFNREVSSLLLSRVQDVTTDVSGILPSLLGLGTIQVQSAGADVEFRMRGIPRPEQMRDIIMRYVAEGPKETGV